MIMGPISTPAVDVEAVTMPGDIRRYDLIASFLKMRKRVFVEQKAWPLFHADDIEFEQYDTFDTTYIIAHDSGKVLGGARLRRTDRRAGAGTICYSYMIRDAYLGLLPGMPTNLCHQMPPMEETIWELTRLVALPGSGVVDRILETANAYLYTVGAERCLFLGSPAFLRMASRLGWSPKAMGDVVGNDDGRFVAFDCAVIPGHTTCNIVR